MQGFGRIKNQAKNGYLALTKNHNATVLSFNQIQYFFVRYFKNAQMMRGF